MKKLRRYLNIILGSLIIGVAINLFFVGKNLVLPGVFGYALLYTNKVSFNLSLAILLTNIFFLVLGLITYVNKKALAKSILPFILIPAFTFLSTGIGSIINLEEADMLLITIFGGALVGFGHSFIYKENRLVCGTDILDLICKKFLGPKYDALNYFLDAVWVIFAIIIFGVEAGLYSLIAIIIVEVMRKRGEVGIGDSKVFYIITKEERAVKRFIMDELHYDLTIFDVKGGFSQTKNRVLMSAIPTNEYYRIREGIREIDPDAFISITDSYEVVNSNVSIRKR